MGFEKLMMNKKGLEFKSAVFTLVAIGMVLSAVSAMILTWGSHYDSGISYDLDKYDPSSDITSRATGYEQSISPQSGESDDDTETRTFRGVFGIIVGIFNPFRIIYGDGGMLDSISSDFDIPSYVIIGISTIMILAVVFTIAAIIFKLPRRSA